MPSDTESPLNNSQTSTRSSRSLPRSHPRVSGYRFLFLASIWGLAYAGRSDSASTASWICPSLVVSTLYWVGLYELECPGKLRWLFDSDFIELIKGLWNRVQSTSVGCDPNICLTKQRAESLRYLNSRTALRMVLGSPQMRLLDAEQRLQLGAMRHERQEEIPQSSRNEDEQVLFVPDVVDNEVHEANATGVQIDFGPSWTTNVVHRTSNNRPHSPFDTIEGLVECSRCTRTFSDQAFRDHCAAKADHPYCESCETLFCDGKALRNHLRSAAVHRSERTPQITDVARYAKKHAHCQLCDKTFVDHDALQQHTANSSAHHFCKKCSRDFPDLEAMCQHLAASSAHRWCFRCSKDFDSKQQLKKHCAIHASKSNPTECPLCDTSFANPFSIGPHIERGCS